MRGWEGMVSVRLDWIGLLVKDSMRRGFLTGWFDMMLVGLVMRG